VAINGVEGINYSCTVTITSTTTTTTTDLTFVGKIIERIKAWLADAQNGLAKIFAGEVETKKLCVQKADGTPVCLTGEQVEEIINHAKTPVNTESNGGGTVMNSQPDTNPPFPTSEPQSEPNPQPTPETTNPEPDPQTQPESNPTTNQNTGETTP
jgi:nitrogen regulatory protein PII